ncbi:hypothetical protein LTR87_017423 [Friedmanniomyces endolithicus]|nr:hypothetical protein LTR87_017423 [Friedmanniomyces endolithicus]
MAQTNVSSCVLSIVASYSSGLDVFKQLREKRSWKKQRSRATAQLGEAEVRLARSLRQGPEDIGREYLKSVQAAGEWFAVGDVIAQSSLAEIVLKLNTGLVSIISSFLGREREVVQMDYASLTELSERSREDTCRTLRQLLHRMQHAQALYSRPGLPSNELVQRGSDVHDAKRRKKRTHSRVRGPMLARVTIENSSQRSQIAVVKSGERKKKSTSSTLSRGQSEVPSAGSSARLTLPSPPYEMAEPPLQPARPSGLRSNTSPSDLQKSRSKQSALSPAIPHQHLQRPELLRATLSTPRLHSTLRPVTPHHPLPLPQQPRTRPLPENDASKPTRSRKPTPTFYSIASDGTKLGEIPLHKWAVPFDFDAMSLMNREAERDGWPVGQLEDGSGGGGGGEKGMRKKRFGVLRGLWRKGEVC